MKALFTSVSVVLLAGFSFAQNVQYKVTRDDPGDINNFWMHLDIAQFDMAFGNWDALSFNAGILGTGLIGDRLGFDYTLRHGYLTMGKLSNKEAKSAYQIELGGLLKIGDNTRVQNTKVVLDSKTGTQVGPNGQVNTVETVTFIHVPANRRTVWHARGGLYMKRNPFSIDAEDAGPKKPSGEGTLTNAGIYIGLSSMHIKNVYISTDAYGKCRSSSITRFYYDLIFVPVPMLDGQKLDNAGPLGFRFGWNVFAADIKKNARKGGFGTQIELGMRPADGFYMSGTVYITLMRRKAKVLGYKPREGANDKGQIIEKE